MAAESGKHAGGEDDLFDRWLAHRDSDVSGQPRASTVPPAWAPRVVVPPAEEVGTHLLADELPDPLPEPVLAEEPPLAEEPVVVAEEPVVVAEEPVVVAEPVVVTEPVTPDTAPLRMTFAPRTRARTAVGIGTLLAAGAAVIGCYVAARERDEASIGIAVTLWILTGIIWAVHSGTSVTRLSVRGGQLQVQQHGVRTTIDLTSSYTPVEVHGRPGRHGWRVVFRRRDMSAFVIDQTMVDPAEFMRVLRYYRPGIDADAGPRAAV